MFSEPGSLYIVSTPIGNLGDMTYRAVDTLRTVGLILAEDTRHFAKLVQHFNITTPVKSYYDEKERVLAPKYLAELESGTNIALVSDAGTPLLSDPGYRIVSLAAAAGIKVIPVPGASALLSALVVAGFEVEKFYFEGFLPDKSGRRKATLELALQREHATVIYESPHRIVKTLGEIAELEPLRQLSVARELTKLHEEILRGDAQTLFGLLSSRPSVKGEFVLVIRGNRE